MADRDPMHIYLNDHLAGATAACDLTEQLARENAGEPFGEFMERIHSEIDRDRGVLLDVMARFSIDPDPVKQLMGKASELIGRVKIGGSTTDAKRLLAMETLTLGIEGKACLWAALEAVQDDYGQLGDLDFKALAARARAQRADVETERLAVARSTLGRRATVPG